MRGVHGDETGEDAASKIRAVLAEKGSMAVDAYSLAEDADLYRAGLSSMAAVNVMFALEEAFGVEFPTAMLNRDTFGSICAIRAALAKLGSAT